jgi:hypothetical protein
MSENPTHRREVEPGRQPNPLVERPVVETRPWYAQPVMKVLLWSMAVSFVVFAVISVLMLVMAFGTTSSMNNDFDAFTNMNALQAAGVFGRGANGQLIAGLRAVVGAIKDNLLGFVGATIVLAIIGLAISLGAGDPRAQERVSKLVQGVLMLAAATGFVA